MKNEKYNSNLEQIFNQVKDKYMKDLSNFYFEQSYQQAFSFFDNIIINTSIEKSELLNIVQSYTFEEFLQDQSHWLKSGKQYWYICGNYGENESINLAEDTKNLMNFKPLGLEEVADICTLSLQNG